MLILFDNRLNTISALIHVRNGLTQMYADQTFRQCSGVIISMIKGINGHIC